MSSPLERPKYCSLDLFRPSALTPGSHGVDHIKELSKAPLKHHTPSLSDLALTTHIHEFVGCCLELIGECNKILSKYVYFAKRSDVMAQAIS
mmetsp:Transcript_9625/g.27840  ORF Transcript_9625/g.27840 Transcript_9625/m.27840 type:complete len:92 (+) Transcript_9625:966-1241(+)